MRWRGCMLFVLFVLIQQVSEATFAEEGERKQSDPGPAESGQACPHLRDVRKYKYGCADRQSFVFVQNLGSGWTKSAQLVKHNTTGDLAVAKIINPRGHIGRSDVIGASRLLLLETIYFDQLASPYVVKLMGYCSLGEPDSLTVWVEYMDQGLL